MKQENKEPLLAGVAQDLKSILLGAGIITIAALDRLINRSAQEPTVRGRQRYHTYLTPSTVPRFIPRDTI